MSHELAVMYLGRIVAERPTEEVTRPRPPGTRAALIAAAPVPSRRAEGAGTAGAVRGEVPSALAVPAGSSVHPRRPLATDICRTTEPPVVPLATGHVAACHHTDVPLDHDERDHVSSLDYRKGLHDLGNGCHAWLQPDGSWGWSNSGLIAGSGTSLLVDTLFDLALTAEMLDGISAGHRHHPSRPWSTPTPTATTFRQRAARRARCGDRRLGGGGGS